MEQAEGVATFRAQLIFTRLPVAPARRSIIAVKIGFKGDADGRIWTFEFTGFRHNIQFRPAAWEAPGGLVEE